MIDEGEKIPVAGPDGVTHRPVTAGDILILVRRRSAICCRDHPRLQGGRACPSPGPTGSRSAPNWRCAILARSCRFSPRPKTTCRWPPRCARRCSGWTRQALFDLAHGRNSLHLWPALRARRAEYPDALAIIDDLMDQADYLRPYDLIERILTRHDGRRNLLARLGAEAEDGIDSLLSQALAYEATDIPSLTGFLQWMETDDLEIKRQLGTAQGQIRVMTVHGAKGLEAPVVILPDTGTWRTRAGGALIDVEGLPLWRVSADDQPPAMAAAAAEARARDEAERLRLLYVALTRAESWLIVAAAGDLGSKGGTWHDRVRMAMESAGAAPLPTPTGEGLRLAHGDWDGPARPTPGTAPAPAHDLPGFATTHAPAPPARARAVSPSDLGGAKALPGDAGLDEEAAKRRGTQVHLLLERLPDIAPPGWPEAAEAMLPDLSAEARDDLLAEATTVLTRPELAFLFAGDTLAEVPVSAEIDGIRYHGVIDRLVVSEARILAVDFKSNATVPARAEDVPEGIQRQMGAYDAALRQVFPGRPVDTAILWTRTAGLMPLPHDTVTEAFARRLALDGNDPPT
jgi:ATP-dependent helicase/nuclease subunit A